MKKRSIIKITSTLLIICGILLVLGAAALFVKVSNDDAKAKAFSQEIVSRLKDETPEAATSPSEKSADAGETLAVIDDVNYLGYLSFVGYDVTLPVFADWSFEALNYAPARYSGTVKGNDLVIAAHNYYSHFFLLNEMVEGNEVDLTQADGSTIRYIVKKIETLEPTELNKLTAGEYDLTLFTCTPTGRARATVRCNKI